MAKNKKTTQQKPKEIEFPSRKGYQPSRADLREEFYMPEIDIEMVRKAFFQPVKVVESKEN